MMTEESFVDFKCPYCGEVVSFPKEYAGIVQECANCAESVVVPGERSELGLKPPIPITTGRLVLRRFRGSDWKDLLEIASDEELFRYLEGHPLGEEEISRWLEVDGQVKLTTRTSLPEQAFCLGLELPSAEKLIGYVSLSIDLPRLQTQILPLINRQYQRQSLATEAIGAVVSFCFAGIGLRRVTAWCDSRNAAAGRLFEKAGWRREGEFLKDRFLNGEWVNTTWYAQLREEPPRS